MPWKIGIIGTGNVASFWVKALKNFPELEIFAKGHTLGDTDFFIKNQEVKPLNRNINIDFYLLAVTNDAIDMVLQELPPTIPVFICAGFHASTLPHVGYMYPLQSIHLNDLPELNDVPFLVEFNSLNAEIGQKFLNRIGAIYQETSTETRHLAHTAAVFLNNFAYYICTEGLRLVPPDLSKELLKPMVHKTFVNIFKNIDLQTGPARRKDIKMIQEQQEFLQLHRPEVAELYRTLSHLLQKKYNEL
jgi:hypothetical protein